MRKVNILSEVNLFEKNNSLHFDLKESNFIHENKKERFVLFSGDDLYHLILAQSESKAFHNDMLWQHASNDC